MNFQNLLIFIAFASILLAKPANAEQIKKYTIDETGTTISFPLRLFQWEEDLPEDKLGIKFTSDDGGALTVFSYVNETGLTPKNVSNSIRQNTGENFVITYERLAKSWLVQSGYEDGIIYYQRVEFTPSGHVHGMLLKYPQTQRAKYDKQIRPMARSLSGS